MENITVRSADARDLEQLRLISEKTFVEAFSSENSRSDIEQYVQESFSTERLASELSNQNSSFYFAEYNGCIIGYLKLNFGESQTDLRDSRAVEIERIYVTKQFYGQGAAKLLLQQALQVATDVDADYIWLGVWEMNSRAISFYTKNGFVEFDKHLFKLGSDLQTDVMMKRPLKTDR